ncbi:MAG: glycoside hydrolase family 30 protein [Lachnospirales bacterium]
MKTYESKKSSYKYLVEVNERKNIKATEKISINKEKTYQKHIGFGGAFTESTCYMLSMISKEERRKVLENYFDNVNGSGYNFCRLHIHSCDFSMSNYEYSRDKEDKELLNFNISNDLIYIIPIIKEAMEIASEEIIFFASPWSPPSFMKTTNMMNHGGKLRAEYANMWALYFVKFIKAYEDLGIKISGVTVQNEPSACQTWESCIYTAEEERDFVKNHLAPMFKKHNLDTKIIMHDHNRNDVFDRMDIAFSDDEVFKNVWGTGVHWYMSEDYENLTKLHEKYPEKHIVFTEGCCAYNEAEGGFTTGGWENGEQYAYDIINNFNNYVEAFCDWNMVLDEFGGPNHVKNFCDAPVMIHTDKKITVYQNSFYYIQHFAKFIKKGYERVDFFKEGKDLHVTAYKGDNEVVCVLLNKNQYDVNYSIEIEDVIVTNIIPARGIHTVVI